MVFAKLQYKAIPIIKRLTILVILIESLIAIPWYSCNPIGHCDVSKG